MRYISTRGQSAGISFEEVLLSGPAPDGGLYMPDVWPRIDMARIRITPGMDITQLTWSILALFAGAPDWNRAIERATREAHERFSDKHIAPLRELGPHRWLMELFHGPTLAFKDFALQILAPLMNEALTRRKSRALVIAATSGDTGAAAVAALAGQSNIDLIVLHPKGRISEVQRRQMTTSTASNVRNIAIEGTFDDAQALVKQLFADRAFAAKHRLAAINSINWVRIAVQSAYYVAACLALKKEHNDPLSFSIPSGNFGNAFAGFVAKKIGAPIGKLIVATNANDSLATAIAEGKYARGPTHATLSPAMDIQVASNFERMLFECYNRNPEAVRSFMDVFAKTGSARLHPAAHAILRETFQANRVLDSETVATMKIVHRQTGLQLDPHTAVGLTATRIAAETEDAVTLATAHPAKFLEAVHIATGTKPELPESMRWILTAPENYDTLPNEEAALRNYIEQGSR